ncbi:hypothetical protein RDI58_015132 [Solanum bulbocastanum]|uniref:RNase H type-1 domain-containing protein n=1 Tax=Solanum bulbocastanum TaxID=147425 RepID=A0AAN8TKA4_SOLBU
MSFLVWRAWKYRVPVDEVLQKMGIQLVSKCWCCQESKHETLPHLFLTSSTASKLWRLFANFAGINMGGLQLSLVLIRWWTMSCRPLYYLAVSWRPPEQGMLKCNTDGVFKGNPGRSCYDFCLRNHRGDLIYAQGKEILKTTNITAETIAVREALYHCVTMGLSMISMETDSLFLVKILSRVGNPMANCFNGGRHQANGQNLPG